MKGHYNKNSKLDFGRYKGYELGIVYVFDPYYIDWCIKNIDRFYISDLNELKEYAVINKKFDWLYKMNGDPILIPNVDIFYTFQELIDNVDLGEEKHFFSYETLKKNESKSFGISNKNIFLFEEDDDVDSGYERGGFHEEYYNYDDYYGIGVGYDDWKYQRTWDNEEGNLVAASIEEYDDWNDQRTWYNKKGNDDWDDPGTWEQNFLEICDMADNCYECPFDQCIFW